MACQSHAAHTHSHGAGCGHAGVQHEGHVGYLHDGHLHCAHNGHFDEHVLAVGAQNPAACTPSHSCQAHAGNHAHGDGCGHEAVPHGDHVDYCVGDHLHHPHGAHCDDHGTVQMV